MLNLLNEYYITLKSEDSGLPINLWIDNTCSYQNSGHIGSYRLKIQPNPSEKSTKNFVPMLLPSCEIVNRDEIKFSDVIINKVKEFALKNMDFLMYMSQNPCSKEEVYKNLVNVDGFNIIPQDENNYRIIDAISHNGFRRVQNTLDDKYNFIDDDNNLISDNWFVNANPFEKYNGTDLSTFVNIGNDVWKRLTIDGKLENI